MKNIKGTCPICDNQVISPQDTQESEILTCKECENRIVVEKVNDDNMELQKAPEIEEDWGQ